MVINCNASGNFDSKQVIRRAVFLLILGVVFFAKSGTSQTLAIGLTGSYGLVPRPNVQRTTGSFIPDVKQSYFAQGGIYVQASFGKRIFVRVSEQPTAIQYGTRVDFDPNLQPEVPFQTDGTSRFWLLSRQADLLVGYRFTSTRNKEWAILLGGGVRRVFSSAYSYSFTIALTPTQAVRCFENELYQADSRRFTGTLGLERKIQLWTKYAIHAAAVVQWAGEPEARGSYEFFPARTVSYSSGTFRVSSFSASLRITAPLLWWNKRT